MSDITVQFKLHPARVTRDCWSALVFLLAMSLLTHALAAVSSGRSASALADVWNPDLEQSVPTWFSSFLLGFAAFLLWRTSKDSALAGEQASAWQWLGLIFAGLSMEEVAGFHERTIGPLRDWLHASGAFAFAWVVPGVFFVAFVAIRFLPFLRSLAPSICRAFLVAGAVYVGGALVMEMVDAYALNSLQVSKGIYFLMINVEEFLEMSGATLFISAILRHWQTQTAANPNQSLADAELAHAE